MGGGPSVPAPDFRRLFESVPGAYLVLNPTFAIVAVTEAYLAATMTRRVLDLNQSVHGVVRMLERLRGEHVRLKVGLESGLGCVHADPGQIEQVIVNLAINARDAMPHSGTLSIATSNVTIEPDFAKDHIEVQPGPYLLLTDVVLPQLNGRELAQRIEELRPGIRLLFMSGYTDDAILVHGVLDEGVHFIQKPLTPGALCSKVREVLDTRKS
jgi:CheY-like chemotaxis protein